MEINGFRFGEACYVMAAEGGGSLQSIKTFIMSPTGPTHWTALQGGQQMQLFLASIPPICFIPAQHLGSI